MIVRRLNARGNDLCSKHWIGLVVALGLALVAADARADVLSTFDTDLEGWTGTNVNLAHAAAGGNPGGFMRATDPDALTMQCRAPVAFMGDLSSYDGGTISFDAIELGGAFVDIPIFGNITISDGVNTAALDIAAGGPVASWTPYSGAFDATTWGVAPATWSTLIANVTSMTLDLEYNSVVGGDDVGIDNFSLRAAPIPQPTSLVLGIVGVCGAAMRRRKNKAWANA